MPDNDKRRNDIEYHLRELELLLARHTFHVPINKLDDILHARYHIDVAHSFLDATDDLLDHDRQPVDGSPPDAAD